MGVGDAKMIRIHYSLLRAECAGKHLGWWLCFDGRQRFIFGKDRPSCNEVFETIKAERSDTIKYHQLKEVRDDL